MAGQVIYVLPSSIPATGNGMSGAVQKVCHTPGGGRGGVHESVTVCDWGKDHVTSHCQFFTIHSFIFMF